ncbi:MAG: thioredoxin family protein [Pseudomonadota bacterium]
MKSFLTIMALAVLAIMPAAFAEDGAMMKKHMMEDKAKVHAVVFYSDTCGSCKILEPKMEEAMGVVNTDRVNVVKLDFSNAASIEASKKLAADQGVGSTLQAYGAKTGFVVLVDDAGNEIAKLTKKDSAADIAAKVTASALSVGSEA